MRNEVIYDKNGRPDIMVVFTPSELGLPDTLRGRKVKEYAISKYQNTLIDGVPYSLPFMKPAVNISHDEAIRLCESKGEGWHLITNDEWVALGFWSWDAACVRFICDSDTLDDLDSDKKQPEPKKRSILAPDFIGRIKQALARQFQKLYEAAHGEDPEGFAELAEKATDEELAKAAKLSATLAQVNAAVDMYELTAKQLKLAATTSITIKTEVNDHE